MTHLDPVPDDACCLGACRVLKNGTMRVYDRMHMARCASGVRTMLLRAEVCGLRNPREVDEPYAVIDVFNADGDIVADYACPDPKAFRYLTGKLRWRWCNREDDQ